MRGWMAAVGGTERTARRMTNRGIAGNFIDRDITASGLGQGTDLDNDGLCCAELFSVRDNYAIMTTLWMTCNRVSRATTVAAAAAAAATLLRLIVNRIPCNASSCRCRTLCNIETDNNSKCAVIG